jgi:hypothetical protein
MKKLVVQFVLNKAIGSICVDNAVFMHVNRSEAH